MVTKCFHVIAEWLILVLNCWQGHQTTASQHALYRQDDCIKLKISTPSCNSASATHSNNMKAGFKLGFVPALILTYCLCCTWAARNNVISTLILYSKCKERLWENVSKTAGPDLYEAGLEYELEVGSSKLQKCSRNDGKLK